MAQSTRRKGHVPLTKEPPPRPPGTKVMKYKCTFSATVSDVFKRRGWVTVEDGSDDWDIYFCDMVQMRDLFTLPMRSLQDHQRVGHFRNNYEISRKNFMVRNLKRLKSRVEKSFGRDEGKKCAFFPTTFILPMEEKWFLQEFRFKPSCFWIIKPAAGAQGRGIFIFRSIKDFYDWRGKLDVKSSKSPPQTAVSTTPDSQNLNNLSQASYLMARLQISPDDVKKEEPLTSDPETLTEPTNGDSEVPNGTEGGPPRSPSKDDVPEGIKMEGNKNDVYVIQQYIANPYLIGGRKFDIRFFVLVTSFMPLRAWMYREGFARFSQGQFSLESLQDVYIHLTNVAIQRTAEDYNPEMGSKWSMGKLRQYLTARHGHASVQKLMNQIDNIVVRTLQSVHHLIIPDRHCFEVYGFDVLIDDVLNCWLLEVNCSPSFRPTDEEDYRLKSALIDDTVHVLDLEERLTGYEKRVGGYDLIWDDGPVYAVPGDCGHSDGCSDGQKLNSFLGCHNDRTTQLRTIFTNSRFVREVHKVNASPNEVTIHGPRYSHSAPNSARSEIKDERFRMPSTPPPSSLPLFTPIRASTARHHQQQQLQQASNSAEGGPSPLMVLGKAVQMKRNLATLLRRCSGENHHRFH